MTADEAFASLMRRNALAIPMVEPSPATERRIREEPTLPDPPESQTVAVVEQETVHAFPEGTRGDYQPRGETGDSGVFSTPTETELEAVGEAILDETLAIHDFGEDPIPPDSEGEYTDAPADDGADTAGYDEVEAADGSLELAKRVRRLAYIPLDGMEAFEDQARDLMAMLQSEDHDKPSLALVSPVRGQGQTELAMRLALSMACRVDYRVLLADFDLRQPQVAKRLGLSDKYFTLADVLRGSCPLGEALVYSEDDNLFVLPTRVSERVGDEFLDGGEVRSLLDQIHRHFDFSILCCGGMDHSDAVTICRHTGFTALAGYCGLSRARDFRSAAAALSEAGARVAGMLLTGA